MDSLTPYASEAVKSVYARTSSISSTVPSDVAKGAATDPGGGRSRFDPRSSTRGRWPEQDVYKSHFKGPYHPVGPRVVGSLLIDCRRV